METPFSLDTNIHLLSQCVKTPYLKSVKFPSKAGPQDWIALPLQRQVESDEYHEFLKLGLGGIFDLDLDWVIHNDKRWMHPMSHFSDFFNYGQTLETWKVYCKGVRLFREELLHSSLIEIAENQFVTYCTEINNGRFMGTWSHQVWRPIHSLCSRTRHFDLTVQLTPIESKLSIGNQHDHNIWTTVQYLMEKEKQNALKYRKLYLNCESAQSMKNKRHLHIRRDHRLDTLRCAPLFSHTYPLHKYSPTPCLDVSSILGRKHCST